VTGSVDGAGRSETSSRSEQDILEAAKGGGFLAGGSFFEFATRFLIAILLARTLGAQDYGLYVLAISAASLFAGISLLGLDDAMVRYVAILAGRRDHPGVSGTLQIGLGVSTAAGLLMGAVLLLAAQPIAEGLFHEPRLESLLRLFAVIVPFLTVSNVLAGVTRGFRKMHHVVLAENVVQSVVRVALLAVLAFAGTLNLYAAALVFGISDVAASVTMIVLLNQRFPLAGSFGPGVRRDAKEIFGFALPLWLSGVLRQFRRNIETVMLGALSSASSVGVFSVAGKVNLVGHVFLLSMLGSVKPILAHAHDRNDHEALSRLYRASTRWTLGLSLPFFLITVLYAEPMLRIFGQAFVSGSTALVVLAFAELANAATGVCGPVLDMTGHTRVKLANTALWTVLLIGGSAVFIPRWGVLGAAVATLIAVATVNVLTVIEVRILERLSPYDASFWKPVVAGIGALVVGLALRMWIPVGMTIAPAMLQAVVVGAVYSGLTLLFGLAPDDRMVVDRVLRKVRLPFGRVRTAGRSL